MNLLRATVELTYRNTRRYGGYLVHMGIVLMFIGFTGHAFNRDKTAGSEAGRRACGIGQYQLKVVDLKQGENDNYSWHRAYHAGRQERRRPRHDGARSAASIKPAGRARPKWRLRPRLNEDLYINFAGMSDDEPSAVIQAYVFPLVSWIWMGGLS